MKTAIPNQPIPDSLRESEAYVPLDGAHSEPIIHRMFEEQVNRTPRKTAAVYQERALSYQELNEKSNILAHDLRQKGVKPDVIVGLLVDRSLEMLISILAILKAGGAYLPIDPNFPSARIDYMLQDSNTGFLITQSHVSQKNDFQGQVIDLDTYDFSQGDPTEVTNQNAPHDSIYLIYTSGSTGKPKGVMLEHRGVYNFIQGITGIIDFSPEKTIVALTTISFDIFVLETLLPLTQGLTILISDPRRFSQDLRGHRVNMLQTTPTTMQLILNEPDNLPHLNHLTEIMLGGEAFPPKLLVELQRLTGTKIYNMYGPTETTVWSTVKDLTQAARITIGQPILNTGIHIIDPERELDAISGDPGELCISGAGVARGYLNRPELTAEKFDEQLQVESQQPSTFNLQLATRVYHTGDIARWLPEGEIEFLGRLDQQVKIRGFRIELGEIESGLSLFPGIKECLVSGKINSSGETYLVAYYLADHDLNVSELIAHLGQSLPEYMIPGFYVRIDQWPLTPNRKIDRKLLPEPDHSRPHLTTDYIAPENPVEKSLTVIWQRILQRDLVGVHDNFFELGGNSVLLSAMYTEVNDLYPGQLDVADIFAYPNIAKLADYIGRNQTPAPEGPTLTIPTIEFPPEYYSLNPSERVNQDFRFTLPDSMSQKLKVLAGEKKVTFEDLLVTVFSYLLADITGKAEITIQSTLDHQNRALPITLDFQESADLDLLSQNVHRQRSGASPTAGYSMPELNRFAAGNDGTCLVPFVINGQYYQGGFLGVSGFVFVFDLRSGPVEIKIANSASPLKASSIEEFIQKYYKLLSVIIKN